MKVLLAIALTPAPPFIRLTTVHCLHVDSHWHASLRRAATTITLLGIGYSSGRVLCGTTVSVIAIPSSSALDIPRTVTNAIALPDPSWRSAS